MFGVLWAALFVLCIATNDDPKPFNDTHGHKQHHLLRHFLSNLTYETFPTNWKGPNHTPITTLRTRYTGTTYIPIRLSIVEDPLHRMSILEPGGAGGCSNGDKRTRVSDTSRIYNCSVAGNGGFFNVDNGACLGNLVTRGALLQNTGLQNANFGIRADGTIVVGYLHENDVDYPQNPFQNLVAGVIWLVRDGKNYVATSSHMEYMGIQTTGDAFITVKSARAALGHDASGRLVLAQVDGKSWERGVDLYELADFLVGQGVVNAINLDGGGSMTSVMGGDVLVNIPSDYCPSPNGQYFCERPVTTIVCFHDYRCIKDEECVSQNGVGSRCLDGKCSTPDPVQIPCTPACVHGSCDTSRGICVCEATYQGPTCEKDLCDTPPPPPPLPLTCKEECVNGKCDTTIGRCACNGTYGGATCEVNLCESMPTPDNGTEPWDLLHPSTYKEWALLSSIIVGLTAFFSCIMFGLLRWKHKDLFYTTTSDTVTEMMDIEPNDREESSESGSGIRSGTSSSSFQLTD